MSESKKDLRPTIKMALQKAMHFCAYQDRCQQDVKKKLKELKLDDEDIDEVIYHLIKEKFLNEERFAKSYCRGKFNNNKWGRNKIIQNLKQKKISVYCINKGLKEIDEEEYLKALSKIIEKKKESVKDKNHWVQKKKISDHAAQKGYEHSLIKLFL